MSTHTHKLTAHAATAHPATLNELPAPTRSEVTGMLSRLLVETLDVALCARHAHWNVRGPDFLLLHDLMDHIGTELDDQADRLAKRIRALGGTVRGTAHTIATESSFKPYPVEVAEGQDHLEALALRLGLLSAEARLSIYECSGGLDPVTADVLVRVNSAIDDVLWSVESHLPSSGGQTG